ncbi:MAG: glutamine-dependent NAD(+) synthetase [Watsoniomyces obsoletus]|nr:MAG: glutamine-dependent NAD(+) synthetase [Watsoniomyces obsoletus]
MTQLITVATCSLNQWALDFDGNKDRIIESIRQAKSAGASLRVGPELEITGYGCLDHFLELDLYDHSWEVLKDILAHEACQGILIDVGMPVLHGSCYYNCRVICMDKKILWIRPKQALANDGNFREMRYFTPWEKKRVVEEHLLPPELQELTGQTEVPFGDAILKTLDTSIGTESCEELFTPDSPHVHMGLNGVEIICNSSGSHHQLRKLDLRMNLILEATAKNGGVYLYANQQGCDGDRLYYDGCAMIISNGKLLAQGSQFSLNDVEVVTATVDLASVRSYRFAPSRRFQANKEPLFPSIKLQTRLATVGEKLDLSIKPSLPIEFRYHCPEEEIALGPACWLWDYLRRSRQAGYFVPLSGGIDSCSTAVIVFSMCREVIKAVHLGNQQVITDVRRICAEPEDTTWLPETPQEICNKLFHSAFLGTENSSKETRQRAKDLATAIGAYHLSMDIDMVVKAITTLFSASFGFALKFKVHGGSPAESLALQNIQARLRMVISYLLAQTLPLVRQRPGGGGLLVLGSANVDESLRGYLTKYDCSSADINPIGGISKTDLKRFIRWAQTNFELPVLGSFLEAVPTAELEPITQSYVQTDEVDMGITYDELSTFGRLRKVERLGPWGQFTHLLHVWSDTLSPRQIFEKVRHFNHYYGINRHKMTVLTPSYHAEQYSPDDNRFDLRPFLYPPLHWAMRKIERVVVGLEGKKQG